eukprot:jgi/Botrbrau1/8299/Bobra.0251s0026.1
MRIETNSFYAEDSRYWGRYLCQDSSVRVTVPETSRIRRLSSNFLSIILFSLCVSVASTAKSRYKQCPVVAEKGSIACRAKLPLCRKLRNIQI